MGIDDPRTLFIEILSQWEHQLGENILHLEKSERAVDFTTFVTQMEMLYSSQRKKESFYLVFDQVELFMDNKVKPILQAFLKLQYQVNKYSYNRPNQLSSF